MTVDHECRGFELLARLRTKPADDSHAAIVAVLVDKVPAFQIMVEVNLVPSFAKRLDALGSRLHPDCAGIFGEETDSTLLESSSRKRIRMAPPIIARRLERND